jgi:hypothetical protein
MARTTPPSARNAAPVVAEARELQTSTINAAISEGSAKRLRIEDGRALRKKFSSTSAALLPEATAN